MKTSTFAHKITAVIVTGGSSGIGECFIQQLHTLNPEISFCNLSRTEPGLISEKSLKIRHFPCDISSPQSLAETFPALEQHLDLQGGSGEILLINNSGFGCYGPSQDLDPARQLQMLDLNIRGLVHLTTLLLPRMLKSGGVILDVASTSAFQPTPRLSAYGASKAFVLHWNLALGNDLRGTRVRTLCLCPGPTATNFFRAAGFEESPVAGYGQTTAEVVSETLCALAKGKRLVVTGRLNKLMAALGPRFLPKTTLTRIAGAILARIRQPG